MKLWNFILFLLMPLTMYIGEGDGGETTTDEAATTEGQATEQATTEEPAEVGQTGAEEEQQPTDSYAAKDRAWLVSELDRMKAAEKDQRSKRQAAELQARSFQQRTTNGNGKQKSVSEFKTIEEYDQYVQERNQQQFQNLVNERSMDERLATTQSEMQQKLDGSNGLPGYDEVVDAHVIPLIKADPGLYNLIRKTSHPAGMAYLIGINEKFGGDIEAIGEMFKSQARGDLVNKINKTAKDAVTLKGKKDTTSSKGMTAEDLMRMSNENFEKEIAKVKGL